MAQQTQTIDGQNPLDAQENALNLAEQMLAAKVTQYAKKAGAAATKTAAAAPGAAKAGAAAPVGTSNEAVLVDVPIGQQPHALYLKAADTTTDPSQVTPPQPGQTLVFHGIAYVSGVEKLVLGFRQP
jgi:hypothetical protein